jgi:ribosomal protein S18 acetylase RimI-like enzyme
MPEIEIRPAAAADIPLLITLDHTYSTDHVWQMEFSHPHEAGQVSVNFRQVRLPRSIRVDYPRPPQALLEDWTRLSSLLVAWLDEQPVGYTSLVLDAQIHLTWVADLVVDRRLRRQGIGSALVLSAAEWSVAQDSHNLVLEMQPKNYPAIRLSLKLGFQFCGYNDYYYPNQEIGIFFRKSF